MEAYCLNDMAKKIGFVGLFSAVFISIYTYLVFCLPMATKEVGVIIRVEKSTTAKAFVRTLYAKHLIKSDKLLLVLIRGLGLQKKLKAGVYQVSANETLSKFLSRVVSGDVLTEKFRIIEGTTQKQVASNLSKAPFLNYQAANWSSIKASDICAQDTNSNKSIGKDISSFVCETNLKKPSLEGSLLADTYTYDAMSDGSSLISRAHENLKKYLLYSWQHRSPNLPYKNPYELLVVASILEKETASYEERRLISGVVINRLQKHMPLQMDPTVIYALGESYLGHLTHDSLKVDSPYNSYLHRGLPPGPIAMVGRDAIDASAHPTVTNYLYFVAKADGSHEFSTNYAAHKLAILHASKG